MGFCVYHFEKGKSQASAIGNHIDRKEGKEHSYKNADPSKSAENIFFKCNGHNKPLQKAINDRIKEGYKGKKAIRKDAVKYLKHVLTGSHEDMIKLSKDKSKFNSWIRKNYDFMEEEFGKENIVRFVLHLDERTPHLHCVTVPLTEDGKLSAKLVTGDRTALQERQTRYANSMQEFNLQRGVEGSKAKHTTLKEYYGAINKENKTKLDISSFTIGEPPIIEKPKKTEILFSLDEWSNQQNQALTLWKQQLQKELDAKIETIGKTAVNQIKIKRFKDVNYIFASKRLGNHKHTLNTLKNTAIERDKLQITIDSLTFEVENANEKGRRDGRKQLVSDINKTLKQQNVQLSIKDGEIQFNEIKEPIKKQKKQRGR